MKKTILIAVVLIAALVPLFVVTQINRTDIGRDAALAAALDDAGLTRAQVHDVDTDLERDHGTTYYEVSFEYLNTDYEYAIDAKDGKVLSVRTDD